MSEFVPPAPSRQPDSINIKQYTSSQIDDIIKENTKLKKWYNGIFNNLIGAKYKIDRYVSSTTILQKKYDKLAEEYDEQINEYNDLVVEYNELNDKYNKLLNHHQKYKTLAERRNERLQNLRKFKN